MGNKSFCLLSIAFFFLSSISFSQDLTCKDFQEGVFYGYSQDFGGLKGNYFSPKGTPLLKRALPPGANTSIYNSFEVTKPFSVQQSTVAPAFGKVGTGTQYHSPFLNAKELLKEGFIKPN